MAAICVDAGTTVIKAVGYDDGGRETVVVRQPAHVLHPKPGWAEQDMMQVRNSVFGVVRAVANQLPGRVEFLAVTAQGDGAWLIDHTGAPTGHAVLWNDSRATSIVEQWSGAGLLAEAYRRNGSVTFAGLPNAILSWMRAHDPGRLAASAALLTCGGWLFGQLAGVVIMEESDASAPFGNPHNRSHYDPQLLELFDLAWAERLLPPVADGGRRVAPLCDGVAAEVCLPAGTPVVAAPYDIASTAIGVGAIQPGQACCILGTTLCTEVVTDRVTLGPEPLGLTVSLGVAGHHLRAMPTLAGTQVLTWATEQLGLTRPNQLIELANHARPGASGLVFLPYLSPAGERAPFVAPQACGALLGLCLEHGREEFARAVVEGLTLVIRDCLAACGVTPAELRICGGGAANDDWAQLIADIVGLPVRRCTDTETGARGAYVVGRVATGAMASAEEAVAQYVNIRDPFEPDPALTPRYDDLFGRFVQLRQHAAGGWPQLAALRQEANVGHA
ncbi:FGGY family carbohydrate kinase [Micromonospora sp. NPDC047620]|uniref:FGGY family carbohydrate kinase n=1 Tax=Micromonospora sp. NPDC047620 TaxID=3364251 RepID=UPI00371B6704